MTLEISDRDVLQAKRDMNLHGVGLVFLVNGLLLALFWVLCYQALGGALSARADSLPGLAFSGYSVLGFGCLGYILIMDIETAMQDGAEMTRRITMDWLWWGLLPVAAYIALSAAFVNRPALEPRHTATAQGLLAGALVLYGFVLTRVHFPAHAPPS